MKASVKSQRFMQPMSPSVPFTYKFADDEYAKKFNTEERVGKLASSFAILAIFISCLGLFGMASFMAEQRTKEIGVRKVLELRCFGLWCLISKDFMLLVVISLFIYIPSAYYFMFNWLQKLQLPHRPFLVDIRCNICPGSIINYIANRKLPVIKA